MTTFKNLISLIIDIFIRPLRAFDKIKEGSYLGWALLIIAAYGILIHFNRFYKFNSGILETIQILSYIVVVFPLLVYINIKLLGGKGNYAYSIQIIAFSNMPLIVYVTIELFLYVIKNYWNLSVLGLIRILTWVEPVISIWLLLLLFIGIKIIHGFTNKQAVITVLIYLMIGIILHSAFYFYVIRPEQIVLMLIYLLY